MSDTVEVAATFRPETRRIHQQGVCVGGQWYGRDNPAVMRQLGQVVLCRKVEGGVQIAALTGQAIAIAKPNVVGVTGDAT